MEFHRSEPLSVGVELELQLIDSRTLDLKSVSSQIIERIGPQPWLQPELLQGMLEITSSPRSNVNEVEVDIRNALARVDEEARALGAKVACAGTHPTAKHWERPLFPISRYQQLIDRNQYVARRLMIFGMHVHIGLEDGDTCISLLNELQYLSPIFLALSASSPFWESLDTGLASARSTIFEAIPTGGHPCKVADWNEFSTIVEKLIRANAIRNVKDIWWDLRPSPGYGTLEIRVCDGLPTIEENMAVAALMHATAALILKKLQAGEHKPLAPDWMVRENKWRAARYGIDGDIIVHPNGETRSIRRVAFDLLDELKPVFSDYHYVDFDRLLRQALFGRTAYSLQREIFHNTGDLKDVTRFLVEQMDGSLRGKRPYSPLNIESSLRLRGELGARP